MSMKNMNLERLLDIGISLSKERDALTVFTTILDAAMDFTQCDGGTLYTKGDDCLIFRLMITKSQNIRNGMNGEEINLPPVQASRQNVCYRAVLDGEVIQIDDVYDDTRFNFDGPKKYDAMTGYHTKSQLVVPMENDHGEIIGVLQLINALDDSGAVTEFDPEDSMVIQSLASQAAIRLTTLNYNEELHRTFDSFVRVMSTAIDARTPYNANHTRNMAHYCENFLYYLDEIDSPLRMDAQHKRELIMAVWLHDIGKLVIPLEVMDKETRLGPALDTILTRFRIIGLLNETAHAKGERTDADYESVKSQLADTTELIGKVNGAGFVNDELMARVEACASLTYKDENGTELPWLTDDEMTCLRVRKGTLTDAERKIMESHAKLTAKMLGEMYFSNDLINVGNWAGMHHEFINGTGYPNHLKDDKIPYQVRLITILDIFDALTARDRPYKQGMPVERALSILHEMVTEGKLDADLLAAFESSQAWL